MQATSHTAVGASSISKPVSQIGEDALFAALCEIEAHAAYRIFGNDSAMSKLTTIRELARKVIEARTGSRNNPNFSQPSYHNGYIKEVV